MTCLDILPTTEANSFLVFLTTDFPITDSPGYSLFYKGQLAFATRYADSPWATAGFSDSRTAIWFYLDRQDSDYDLAAKELFGEVYDKLVTAAGLCQNLGQPTTVRLKIHQGFHIVYKLQEILSNKVAAQR